MASEQVSTPASTLNIKSVLAELEVPFPPEQVQWRVTNTAKDKKRGQVVPYADPHAYADRLNALFTPQGWTREYKVETMSNITRVKKGESIISDTPLPGRLSDAFGLRQLKVLAKAADELVLLDNTTEGRGHRVAAHFIRGKIVRLARSVPEWAQKPFGKEFGMWLAKEECMRTR